MLVARAVSAPLQQHAACPGCANSASGVTLTACVPAAPVRALAIELSSVGRGGQCRLVRREKSLDDLGGVPSSIPVFYLPPSLPSGLRLLCCLPKRLAV